MKSRTFVHQYWRDPGKENDPSRYLSHARDGRSECLVEQVRGLGIPKEGRILELGCNAGRNLAHLWDAGWRNLEGIEINPLAVELMQERRPDIRAKIYIGAVEDHIRNLPEYYDLIFTVAVLVHIHPDSDWIFGEMAKRTGSIITFEDEVTNRDRHVARNYRSIFEDFGYKEVNQIYPIPTMNEAYIGRVFIRRQT